jgi:hypothetical protein
VSLAKGTVNIIGTNIRDSVLAGRDKVPSSVMVVYCRYGDVHTLGLSLALVVVLVRCGWK